jgi:Cu-processing system permease protein
MLKVFKYSFYNLLRSLWLIIYMVFFLIVSSSMLLFADTFEKAIVSMMSVSLGVIPLISILFGIMYYYSSREFAELLLAQPLKRIHVFLGLISALAVSLALCFTIGVLIPFAVYGVFFSHALVSFVILIVTGVILTVIFVIISFYISLLNENRIKGFGFGILIWLYFALLYDGIFLISLIMFQDYPLGGVTVGLTLLNPIDTARVMILLKMEISSLMGYTGAVFKEYLGSSKGIVIAMSGFLFWVAVPFWLFVRKIRSKDF